VLAARRAGKGRVTLESGYGQQLLLHPFMARSPILHPTRRVLSALEGIKRASWQARKLELPSTRHSLQIGFLLFGVRTDIQEYSRTWPWKYL
jgi:hypothetical protein